MSYPVIISETADPWPFMRRRIKEEKELFGTLTLRGVREKNLLADADKLLVMKDDVQSVVRYLTIELKDAKGDGPEFQVFQRLVNILAALPEHLHVPAGNGHARLGPQSCGLDGCLFLPKEER